MFFSFDPLLEAKEACYHSLTSTQRRRPRRLIFVRLFHPSWEAKEACIISSLNLNQRRRPSFTALVVLSHTSNQRRRPSYRALVIYSLLCQTQRKSPSYRAVYVFISTSALEDRTSPPPRFSYFFPLFNFHLSFLRFKGDASRCDFHDTFRFYKA